MNYQPEIAIVEANTLTCLGLKGILGGNDSYGNHTDFSSLQRTDGRYSRYVCPLFHFRTDLRGAQCFLSPRKRKTIVLASDSPQFQLSGVPVLNIHESEEELVKNILKLHQHAHHDGYPVKDMSPMPPMQPHQEILSAREIEVLVLITKGLINKEIADKLNISLTTVITHRKKYHGEIGH